MADSTANDLARQILSAGKDFHGHVTFKARTKELSKTDRMALIMLDAIHKEYPEATNAEVQEAIVNALWWHAEIASSGRQSGQEERNIPR